jgi:hypothetical protein
MLALFELGDTAIVEVGWSGQETVRPTPQAHVRNAGLLLSRHFFAWGRCWVAFGNFDSGGPRSIEQVWNNLSACAATSAIGLPRVAVPTGPINALPAGVQLVTARFNKLRLWPPPR